MKMSQMKFHEVADCWLQNAIIGLSYSWKTQIISTVKHLNRSIGDKQIDEIKPMDIERLIKSLSVMNPNTKKPASKRLLKAVSNTANQIYVFAIENEITNKNPASGLIKKIPKNAPTKLVEALTDYQKSIVMEVDHPLKLAAVIMMFMGLRTGEILALQWEDFDFEQLMVSVNKSCSRITENKYTVKKGTKNGKSRIVPIPVSISTWLKEKCGTAKCDLVIPSNNNQLHTRSTWKSSWNAYQNELNYYVYLTQCKEKGIVPKSKYSPTGTPDMGVRFNAHQLRHTYATMLYHSNVDVLTAKELLGHSDVKTTLGIYTHLDEKYKKINIIKFDNYIQAELLKASSL